MTRSIKTAVTAEPLAAVIASIDGMGVDAVRETWRALIGEPPPVRAGDLLRRALADELQVRAHGGDPDVQKRLNLMASRHRPGHKPLVDGASYRKGAILTRDWNGERHEVEVVAGGFVWNGEAHASLSSVARAITGVRWNGPRFFGLRQEVRA